MALCPDCGNTDVRIGARYCDECGIRLDPQVGLDPEATLKPAAARALKRKRQADGAEPADEAHAKLPFRGGGEPQDAPSVAIPVRAAQRAQRRAPVQSPPPWARGVGWEAWSAAGPMPARIRVDGDEWVLVDEIEMRNRESEDAHAFAIEGTGRVMRERGSQRYPGGSALETRGYRHERGSAVFRLRGLTPDAAVAIVRQALATGAEHGEVKIDNRPAARIRESELDGRSALRNRTTVLPADIVPRDELSVEIADTGSAKGLTWFHVWVYQPAIAVGAGSPEAAAPARRVGARIPAWAALRESGRDLPAHVEVAGRLWRLADEVAFGDEDSMTDHDFAVVDSQGTYAGAEIELRFPDGAQRNEFGVRFDHGEASWEVSGLTAERDVAMILRTDVRLGNQTFDLSVGGAAVERVRITDRDPNARGRHWVVVVPGRMIASDTARFRASITDPGRGLALFGLWFYQPE